MPTAIENQFVHNYSKLLVSAWTDRNFLQRLQANPAQVLKEYGIATAPNATINIITDATSSSDASLDAQVQEWLQGEQTGTYNLYVPQQPQLGQDTSSAAGEFDVQDTSYCCCCCPCCTCT